MSDELGGHSNSFRTALICVVPVHVGQHFARMSDAVSIRQRGYVEVIPGLISPDDEISLDPQCLVGGRDPKCVAGWKFHLGNFQWNLANELTDAGFSSS